MYLKNIVGHFMVITRHKWVVFKLCCKVGQPWRGLVHDLSKYSPTEFWEGVKYFNGKHSPITDAKKDKGYSQAWLHHKGRNKHHTDYWVDLSAPDKTPIYHITFLPHINMWQKCYVINWLRGWCIKEKTGLRNMNWIIG